LGGGECAGMPPGAKYLLDAQHRPVAIGRDTTSKMVALQLSV
jgi:hypothetical protein